MAKAVLISIRPEWVKKILDGEKTLEVRRNRPKLETPFKVYIYCTSGRPDLNVPISPERLMRDYLDTGSMRSLNCPLGNGKVIGEFVCDTYVTDKTCGHDTLFNAAACMSESDVVAYSAETPLYGWHISNLKIYDAPKKLGEFWRDCLEYSELSTNCWSCENVCGDGDETDCNTDGRLYLRRPPQSWCYVEGLQ